MSDFMGHARAVRLARLALIVAGPRAGGLTQQQHQDLLAALSVAAKFIEESGRSEFFRPAQKNNEA